MNIIKSEMKILLKNTDMKNRELLMSFVFEKLESWNYITQAEALSIINYFDEKNKTAISRFLKNVNKYIRSQQTSISDSLLTIYNKIIKRKRLNRDDWPIPDYTTNSGLLELVRLVRKINHLQIDRVNSNNT